MRRILPLCILLIGFVSSVHAQQNQQMLTVFAASSLSDAFTEIGSQFQAENPTVTISFNFGGSSALATQLVEGGAPADVFASANQKQMDVAKDGSRIGSEPVTFARNRLILIVPSDNPAKIESLNDLAESGVKLVLAAPGVPVRDYTDAMLEKLADEPDYGESYRQAVAANIVSEEDNVRQVVAKVALGEADAGVVYSSDVTPDVASMVLTMVIPDEINTVAAYPIAITNDSANPELAQAFVDYVLSDAGQSILTKWGFMGRCPINPEATPEATAEAKPTVDVTPEATPDAIGC